MQQSKNAIALLITVLFVIVITVAIGYSLRQVNVAAAIVKDESALYQNSMIVEDVLRVLQNSPDIARVADANSSEELFILLSQSSFIPLESAGVSMVIKLSSARAKINPSSLSKEGIVAFREYMSMKMVSNDYVDILLDCMGGIKVDGSYNSAIFNEHPYLFRDSIASQKHLERINDFFAREYNDNSLRRVAFENLFYLGGDTNATIDLNYATTELWEMMLGTNKERARMLSSGAGLYSDSESLQLSNDEAERLARFKTSFFEPVVLVELEIEQNESRASIRFEYDLKSKKGSNFVYEI